MKLIHCADLHLASPLDSRFSAEKARLRKNELFENFSRLADKAVSEKVDAILVAGDIFDEKTVPISAKRRFLKIVSAHPEVDFLCISGNHDRSLSEENNETIPANLKTFGSSWSKYSYEQVDIHGIELTKENCISLYSDLVTDQSKLNIVMMHGQTVESKSAPTKDTIVLPLLKNKHIDYLALGHIHSYACNPLDDRGIYCYSGCLEGRGYDEIGPKGFVLLQIENGAIQNTFVPFAQRTIHEVALDISNLEETYDIERAIDQRLSEIPEKDLVRLILEGTAGEKVQLFTADIEERLKKQFFHGQVKDHTTLYIDETIYQNELSLKGEFVRKVLASNLSENDKARVIRQGLRALDGEEVEER